MKTDGQTEEQTNKQTCKQTREQTYSSNNRYTEGKLVLKLFLFLQRDNAFNVVYSR